MSALSTLVINISLLSLLRIWVTIKKLTKLTTITVTILIETTAAVYTILILKKNKMVNPILVIRDLACLILPKDLTTEFVFCFVFFFFFSPSFAFSFFFHLLLSYSALLPLRTRIQTLTFSFSISISLSLLSLFVSTLYYRPLFLFHCLPRPFFLLFRDINS